MAFSDPSWLHPPFSVRAVAASGCMMNWKAKKPASKRQKAAVGTGGAHLVGDMAPLVGGAAVGNPVKSRRFYYRKTKFVRSASFAPRPGTRSPYPREGVRWVAPLISPCSVMPAVLEPPKLSSSSGDLAYMVEEWGVDGYGSMKGLIRLRCPSGEGEEDDDNEEPTAVSSGSDVEEHLEVEAGWTTT